MFRIALVALSALLASSNLNASRLPMQPLVNMQLIDRDSGDWLRQYPHRGDQWVAGTPGHRYSVRLSNNSGRRVLVVLSVDGVNAVTGQTANPSQGGYVLDPWESTEITGWRKSLNDVAQFEFTSLNDSYAARTGRPRNVGVIGVAVFEEQRLRYAPAPAPPIYRDHSYKEDAMTQRSVGAAPAPTAAESRSADAVASPQRIGTGHGQREWSPVGETTFRRASSTPAQLSEIRYDSQRKLIAMGIVPRPNLGSSDHSAPRAFPGGFVPDPPRWR